MCQLYSAGLLPQCLAVLQFQDRLCIDTRFVQQPIIAGFDGSAPLGYRRAHSHPHYVAAHLQLCSDSLAPGSPSTHPLQFLLAPRRCLACASRSLAYAVMMSMAPSCLMKCETENVDSSSVITRPDGLPGLSAILNRSINQQTLWPSNRTSRWRCAAGATSTQSVKSASDLVPQCADAIIL